MEQKISPIRLKPFKPRLIKTKNKNRVENKWLKPMKSAK